MDAYGDGLLMVIITGVVLLISYRSFRSWVRKPLTLRTQLGFQMNEDIQDHPAVDLLEQAGYELISDKLKVPLSFKVDDSLLHSRLFIDYIVQKDSELYLVRTSRERISIEWTGSGIRKDFLCYLLLYPECAGLLYVDTDSRDIKVISLTIDDNEDE